MASEDIVIKINLDTSDVDSKLKSTGDSIKDIGSESGRSFEKDLKKNISGINKEFNQLGVEVSTTKKSMDEAKTSFSEIVAGIGLGSIAVGAFSDQLAITTIGIAGFFNAVPRAFRPLVMFHELSAALLTFGAALRSSENEVVSFTGKLLIFAGVVSGILGFGLSFLIVKVGELATRIGAALIPIFQKASQAFIDANSNAIVFVKTLEGFNRVTDGAVGNLNSWQASVAILSNELNISRQSLGRAATEIVGVTSQLGLQEDQMKQLIRVVAEYSRLQHTDVFQAAIEFSQALNGNSQSVLKYGVKLTEASNAHFALSKGIRTSFEKLSESEKVQIRFNNLLKQFGAVAGIAKVQADSLAGQQDRFKVNTERLNVALGKGASYIENLNIVYFALNKFINNVGESTLSILGFFGALGARTLWLSGILLSFSFKILAVVSAIKLLNIALASTASQKVFATTIPLFSKSLNDMASSAAGASIQIKSLSDLIKTVFIVTLTQATSILRFFVGEGTKLTSVLGLMTGFIGRLATGFRTLLAFSIPLLTALAPYAAIIGAIVAVVTLLIKSFQFLEERTGSITKFISILSDEFNRIMGNLSVFKGVIDTVSNALKVFGGTVLGGVVASIGTVIEKLAILGSKAPFVAESSKQKFRELASEIGKFNNELKMANFNVFNLAEQMDIASKKEPVKKLLNIEEFNRLRDQIINHGTVSLELLRKQKDDRIAMIKLALSEEYILRKEANDLRKKLEDDFFNKQWEIEKEGSALRKEAAGIAIDVNKVMNQTFTSGFAKMGEALGKGKDGFKGFSEGAMSILGDFAVQLGQLLIAGAISIKTFSEALINWWSWPLALAAGIALVAIGTAIRGSAGGKVGGGGGGTATPTSEAPSVGSGLPEQQQKSTLVNINVEGTVLNPREVGMQIAQILSDTFDSNDTRIVASA